MGRPKVVEKRKCLGLVRRNRRYGQNAYLMTLVDRKSRLTLIGKVSDKKAKTMAKKMIKRMKRVPGVKTITLGNALLRCEQRNTEASANYLKH
ncbi:hypothetical protein CI610_00868 [invertebrate metagenome]|uniref:Integrase catalytic domain-containing protein n=1 Tax=invertebrate metagenome TaxID=1711999 RepID=A0A2H9TAA4_9ZZZZ